MTQRERKRQEAFEQRVLDAPRDRFLVFIGACAALAAVLGLGL